MRTCEECTDVRALSTISSTLMSWRRGRAFGLDFFTISFLLTYLPNSPESSPVLLQNAAIHHHKDPRLAGFFGSLFVDHAFLQPNGRQLQADGFVDQVRHKLGAAKDIHDIDLLSNVGQGGNGFFPQRSLD